MKRNKLTIVSWSVVIFGFLLPPALYVIIEPFFTDNSVAEGISSYAQFFQNAFTIFCLLISNLPYVIFAVLLNRELTGWDTLSEKEIYIRTMKLGRVNTKANL